MSKGSIGYALLILALALVGAATVGAVLAPALIAEGLVAKGTIAALVASCGAVGVLLTPVGLALAD